MRRSGCLASFALGNLKLVNLVCRLPAPGTLADVANNRRSGFVDLPAFVAMAAGNRGRKCQRRDAGLPGELPGNQFFVREGLS